jgi:hypothetical protein
MRERREWMMEVKIKENRTNEEIFNKLHFHPKQEDFLYDLAEFLHSSTPSLHVHAMRGFIFRACRKWQVRNCKPFYSIMNRGEVEMFKFWIEFSSLIVTEVTKRVIKAENELKFERKLGEAYALYQANFCSV